MKPSHQSNLALAKIKWQCRRGMLELDLILLAFFEKRFSSISPSLKTAFVELLDSPDPDIYNWLLGVNVPPDSLKSIIEQVREYQHQQHTST